LSTITSTINHPRRPDETLSIQFPDLPVTTALAQIREALTAHQVIIVVGETGSGKTTQLPKLCLALGRGVTHQIVHTQPRRIAARSVATRIAEELGEPVGALCGYQVRFQGQVSDQTAIKLVTDGLLLAEFRDDPLLSRYDTVIIDEAHERSLNIDFVLGILTTVLAKRPDLKVIVTSATINYEKFSAHFGDAPVVSVSGRTFPVEIRYMPIRDLRADDTDATRIAKAVHQALLDLRARDRERGARFGDILVFLPGERDIRDVSQYLRHAAIDRLDVLPLYARLSSHQQARIFSPDQSGLQRIVLATNVAETSLTVPGIRYVIDSGLARISRYSPRSRLQRLPIEPISQASANQRSGRCGRTEPGVAVRLYDREDFESRPLFTDPEIMRTNLASVVLQCLDLKLGDPERFPFVDPPESQLIRDGFSQLREVDLVTARMQLTADGRRVARLPLDPRIGRILIEAERRQVFADVSLIAATLSVQSPLEHPEFFERLRDPTSQFISWINFWRAVEHERDALSHNQFRKWCENTGLKYNRIREWREVHRQILLCFPKTPHERIGELDQRGIHIALLTGFASQIGQREELDYLGVRQRRFRIPKAALDGQPKWVMAGELVETHRVVARMVARIEPDWVIEAVPQLLKYSHSEPHWSKKQGRALCYRTTRLFGLPLKDREPVGLDSVDRTEARRLFIREGVIEGTVRRPFRFMQDNQAIFAEAEQMQAKLRRVDLIREPDDLIEWFEQRIPDHIRSVGSLASWLKKDAKHGPRLTLMLDDVLADRQSVPDPSLYPERVSLGHLSVPAGYRFAPGRDEDGVSVKVPLSALMQLDNAVMDWTIPGARAEKADALIRGLPKSIRRQLVPIPDFVRDALPLITTTETLSEGLARLITKRTGTRVTQAMWKEVVIDERLKLRIEVVDADGQVIDADRDLDALKERLKDAVPKKAEPEYQALKSWPQELELKEVESHVDGGVQINAYPRLQCVDGVVRQRSFYDPTEAIVEHRRAVAALLVNACHDVFRHVKATDTAYAKEVVVICQNRDHEQQFYQAVVAASSASDLCEVRTADAFQALKGAIRAQVADRATAMAGSLASAILRARQLRQRLDGKIPPAWLKPVGDMRTHLGTLMDAPLERTPPRSLESLDRFIQGIEIRLEKLSGRLLLDAQWTQEVHELEATLQRMWPSYPDDWERQDRALVDLRWQIEEFRVLCFAQTLKSKDKVSFKRLMQALRDYRQ
jgi:ATP-dependent helicase HrpA